MAMTEDMLRKKYSQLVAQIEKKARGEDVESKVAIKKDKEGRMILWSEKIYRDGELVGRREDVYTYDKQGQATIRQRQWDQEGNLVFERKGR